MKFSCHVRAIELDHFKAYILTKKTRSIRCVFTISTITTPNKSFPSASVASNLIRFSKYLIYCMAWYQKFFLSFDPLDFSPVDSLFLVLLFRENGSKMIWIYLRDRYSSGANKWCCFNFRFLESFSLFWMNIKTATQFLPDLVKNLTLSGLLYDSLYSCMDQLFLDTAKVVLWVFYVAQNK